MTERELFSPDEPACPPELGRAVLCAWAYFFGEDDPRTQALAASAMLAHGVHLGETVLTRWSVADALRTERRGRSLLASLECLREL